MASMKSVIVQGESSVAHCTVKPSEKPRTMPIAVSEPLRKVESIRGVGGLLGSVVIDTSLQRMMRRSDACAPRRLCMPCCLSQRQGIGHHVAATRSGAGREPSRRGFGNAKHRFS